MKHLRKDYGLSKADAEEFFRSLSKTAECRKFLAYVDQT
jgi:hypothetical protein